MRRYTITVDLPEDYIDDTCAETEEAFQTGGLTFSDVAEMCENDAEILVTFKAEDLEK